MTDLIDRTEPDTPSLSSEPAQAPVSADHTRVKRLLGASLLLVLFAIILGLAFFPVISQALRSVIRPAGLGTELQYLYSIPGPGQPKLPQPVGVAVADNGQVYVADTASRQVRVYDPAGTQLFAFGRLKDGQRTHLEAPVHLAISGQEVFVTDRLLRGLYVFDLKGEFVRRFIPPDLNWSPVGVSVDKNGFVYVTDIGDPARHKVRIFNPSGMEVLEFGRTAEVKGANEQAGALYYPDRALPYGDAIFVADSNNARIQVFDRAGRFRYFIATGGVPRGLMFDSVGHLLVVDTIGSGVDIYSQSGTKLGTIGDDSSFAFPNDVALDRDGRIYVADRGSSRVQVWGTAAQARTSAASSAKIRWEWLLLALPLAVVLPLLFVSRRLEESEEDDE